jgi:iron(III) transport system ATP-binding protein
MARLEPITANAERLEVTSRPVTLALRSLSKRFDATPVITDLSLDVHQGETVALLGPSGCGKTTTLRLIAGFERPDAGRIDIANTLVSGEGKHLPPEKRRVGMVFQDYALFPHLSVGQNVGYGLPRGNQERISESLALVGLGGMEQRIPHALSGGQQQRVALARALAPHPDIILLDEPFSNLDTTIRARVRDEVRDILRQAGATAVLVTHDQEEALSLADRVAVLLAGKIAQVDTPETLYHHPATRDVAAFVGEAGFLPAEAAGTLAMSALGPVPLRNTADGPVDLLLRPESLTLSTTQASNAEVISRRFFGPFQLLTIELRDGHRLDARVDSRSSLRPGDCVCASIREPVTAFPQV